MEKCNCIQETQKLIEAEILKNPVIVSVNYVSVNCSFETSTQPSRCALVLNTSYERQLKNGRTAKKQAAVNLLATYCPFCGMKYHTE